MVLGHLAWKSDSPLFEAIDAAGSAPSYEDVALPTPPPGSKVSGHLLHPRLKSLGGKGEYEVRRCHLAVHKMNTTTPTSMASNLLYGLALTVCSVNVGF